MSSLELKPVGKNLCPDPTMEKMHCRQNQDRRQGHKSQDPYAGKPVSDMPYMPLGVLTDKKNKLPN